jgi:hypothetical protein
MLEQHVGLDITQMEDKHGKNGDMERVGEALLLDDLHRSSNEGRRSIQSSRVQWFLGFKFSGQINSQQQNCGGWCMPATFEAYVALPV